MDSARFFITIVGYIVICLVCAWLFSGFTTLLTSLALCLLWWHLLWKQS